MTSNERLEFLKDGAATFQELADRFDEIFGFKNKPHMNVEAKELIQSVPFSEILETLEKLVQGSTSPVFEELEIEPIEPFRKVAALRRLNAHLIERLRMGLQTLLIIDEAQNLSDELLEEIRMLSNLETPQSKLLQIVLVGQPELAAKLEQSELRQLRQRVELRHEITPLDARGTGLYVRERLLIAGHSNGEIFTNSALRDIHSYSCGIPRVINVLCDNALLTAFARQSLRVSSQMVRSAADDVGLRAGERPRDAAAAARDAVAQAQGPARRPVKPPASRGWFERWRRRPVAPRVEA